MNEFEYDNGKLLIDKNHTSNDIANLIWNPYYG